MKKRLPILSLLLALLVSQTGVVLAQPRAGKGIPVNPNAKMGLSQFVPTPPSSGQVHRAPAAQALLNRNVTFWINFESRSVKTGMYQLDLKENIVSDDFRPQGNVTHANFAANQGGALYNGVFHCNNGEEVYGLFFVEDFQFVQANDWALHRHKDMGGAGFVADVQTLYPVNNKVYGAFCDAGGNYEWELCEVDLDRLERKVLAKAQHRYLAMGIDRRGRWYGISGIGELYEISRTDGTETLIGNTGLGVTAYDGAASYHQSGCFDPATDTFFWSRCDMNGKSEIYAVNLETAEAELVAAYSDITLPYFMQTVEGHAANAAPAEVGSLAVSFAGAATTGSVSFTLPAKTYDGTALTGSLKYLIEVDGVAVSEGTGAAGAAVSENLTLTAGLHRLDVVAVNDAGRGVLAFRPLRIGLDVPQIQEARTVATGQQVQISWDAATAESAGNLGSVTYTVVRYPDNKVVAKDITATSVSDVLPDGRPVSYQYGVTASNSEQQGHETLTQAILGGDPLLPPYIKEFDGQLVNNVFTLIDANRDGICWETSNYLSYARYCNAMQTESSSTMEPSDDWLVLPQISLKAGKKYYFYYVAYTGLQRGVLAQYEVRMGRQLSPAAMTQVVVQSHQLSEEQDQNNPEVRQTTITVAEDGDYYIGFHATCPKLSNMIAIRGIGLEEAPDNKAPGKVTELTVTPNSEGKYTAEVSFVAPKTTAGGGSLSKISRILVQRDNIFVKYVDNPLPGQSVSVVDDTMDETDNGSHNYVVTAENEYGQGEPVTTDEFTFVGVDRPDTEGMTGSAVEQGKGILISWTPVTTQGVRNGYVDPSKVTYYVYEERGASYVTRGVVTGQTSFLYEIDPNEGDQRELKFSIGASNVAGDSPTATHVGSIIVGKPYVLPFRETFTTKFTGTPLYWNETNTESQPEFVIGDSFDSDGHYYQWAGNAVNSYYSLNTGKLAVKGAANPKVAFATNFASEGSVEVYVQTPDGVEHLMQTINASNPATWQVQKIDLSGYSSSDYVYVKLRLKSPGIKHVIRIDDLNVLDMYNRNLTAAFAAPQSVKAGTPTNVSVEVRNTGDRDQSNFTVTLYDDGKAVYEKTVESTLSSLEYSDVQVPYVASVFKAGGRVTLRAEVKASRDDDDEDNAQEAEVVVVANAAPQPENLATTTEDGGTVLGWQAPQNLSREITEDFEGMEFTDFDNAGITSTNHAGTLGGGWTLWGGFGGTDKFSIDYPNRDSRSAWVVFNNAKAPDSGITPHSGDRFLVSFDITGSEADCWLISPEMAGQAQTIRFFATEPAGADNHESFQVLASSTDNSVGEGSLAGRDDNLGSFTVIGETLHTTGKGWDEFTADLPAGTKYFAIRNVSRAMAHQLCLDDITYTADFGSVVGYNVYGDQQLLGTVTSGTAFTLGTSTATSYAVTALFASGLESMPVYLGSSTGIITIRLDGRQTYDVYSLDGRQLRHGATTLSGLKPGVYIVNGQKTVVRK